MKEYNFISKFDISIHLVSVKIIKVINTQQHIIFFDRLK